MKKLTRFGTAGAAVVATVALSVGTAGVANAERVHGGYFPTLTGCNQAGHNRVEQGFARDWNCAQRQPQGDWHLILFT